MKLMKSVRGFFRIVFFCLLALVAAGCGSTQQQDATQQLLTSDAVDRSVSQIDFRDLSGESVYFDTTYLKNIKGVGFVNADYITSSLRQQLVAARCLLKEKKEDADFIVEARIGTLGMDRHEVTYGMPANNFLSAASSLVPNSPPLPTIPELALAKRNEQLAAAKIGAFAYHRETGEPVWQSGITPIRSTAKDVWVLGAGPFQRGEIYGGTQFAGAKLEFSLLGEDGVADSPPLVNYNAPNHFARKYRQAAKETEKNTPETNPKVAKEVKVAQKPKPVKPKPPTKLKPVPAEKPVKKPKSASETRAAKPDNSSNPLKAATQLDSGVRLRFHFDQPMAGESDLSGESSGQLFRLDPEK